VPRGWRANRQPGDKFKQGGEKLDDVIKWAENEFEGTLRARRFFAPRSVVALAANAGVNADLIKMKPRASATNER